VPHFINALLRHFFPPNIVVIIIITKRAGTAENFLIFLNKNVSLIHDFVGFELICTMNRVRYLDDDDG
jgi:hypothetical protein